MASATASADIPQAPEAVWQLIGGFGSLPDWLPYITSSAPGEGGRTRHLTNADGESIVERLTAFDAAARSYSYTIEEAPFPVVDYLSTITVQATPDGAGSRVVWSGQFTPQGVTDSEASALFQGIYEAGLTALVNHYA